MRAPHDDAWPRFCSRYWPGGFHEDGAVILRRDVGYVLTSSQNESSKSGNTDSGIQHRMGGLQSMSEDTEPLCTRSVHWDKQQQWVWDNNLTIKKVYHQAWWPDYLPYYNNTAEVTEEGKPWDVAAIQLLSGVRTVYVGGSVSFDTVEDSFQSSLELVDRLFDGGSVGTAIGATTATTAASPGSGRGGARGGASNSSVLGAPTSAMEHLLFDIHCSEVDKFMQADNDTWTTFLSKQAGFVSKATLVDPNQPYGECTVHTVIHWASRKQWKSIPGAELATVNAAFANEFGEDVKMNASPSSDGVDVLLHVGAYRPVPAGPGFVTDSGLEGGGANPGEAYARQDALEINTFEVNCSEVSSFISADNATWTEFLRGQLGFISKTTTLDPRPGPDPKVCTVWTFTKWLSREMWGAIPPAGFATTDAKASCPPRICCRCRPGLIQRTHCDNGGCAC